MATARALAAGTAADDFRGNEQIEDSELVVTSARADNLRAFLPAIDDGAGTTVDDGYQVLVNANSSGNVEIVDVFGRRVRMVEAGESVAFLAVGDVDRPEWRATKQSLLLSISQDIPSAGSSTPALGTSGPASSGTVKWIGPVQLVDGTVAYIPCWT